LYLDIGQLRCLNPVLWVVFLLASGEGDQKGGGRLKINPSPIGLINKHFSSSYAWNKPLGFFVLFSSLVPPAAVL
jgi:hypothetical protein